MSSKVATEARKKGAQMVVPSRGLVAQNRFSFPQRVDSAPATADRASPATLAEPELGHDFSQISIHPPVSAGDRGATQPVVQSCPLALASPRACPFGGACHACPARVQAKLADSQPDDTYEHEADRIADFPKGEIMRVGAPLQAASTRPERLSFAIGDGLLQRKCTCGSSKSPLDEKCNECPSPGLQRKLTIGASNDPLEREADRIAEEVLAMPTHSAIGSTVPSIQRLSGHPRGQSDAAPASVDQTLANPGTPLEPVLLQDMERRFGYDFSQVRVHSGAAAEQSACDVRATAYTVGHNIVFGAGRYAPETHQGRFLIAHELTHVVQQGRGSARDSAPGAHHERAAAQAAEAVAAGRARVEVEGAARPGLMRQDPSEAGKGLAQPVVPRMEAMTPEDAYNKLLATRGFEEAIPASELEATEQRLKGMEEQLKKAPDEKLRKEYNALKNRYNISSRKGTGGLAGSGYNTYAIVQVVDKDGYVIAVADGKYTGGSGLHAEEIALDKIRKQLGPNAKFPGARIDVIGDRVVCSDKCKPALVKFATDYDLNKVDGYVFRRPKAVGIGLAAEKFTARSATSKAAYGRPPVRQSENIFTRTVPPTPAVKGGGVPGKASGVAHAGAEPPSPKTALVGATLNVGAGHALGILQQAFKEKILKDMEALPKPKIDKRSSREYLGDPNTAKAMRLIDLLNKNFSPFGKDLQDHHLKLVTQANVEVISLALMSDKSPDQIEKKFALLDSLQDEVRAYEEQLFVVLDNLDALLDLEAKTMEKKKAADDLDAFINNPLVFKNLVERGILSFEEWSWIDSNLRQFSVSIEMTFEDAHKLRDQVRKDLDETSELANQLNKIWWGEFGHQFMLHLQQKEAEQRRKVQASAVKQYGTPIQISPMPLWNSDHLGMWYYWRSRESELLLEIGELDAGLKSTNRETQAALREKRDYAAAELARVRKQMMELLGAGSRP